MEQQQNYNKQVNWRILLQQSFTPATDNKHVRIKKKTKHSPQWCHLHYLFLYCLCITQQVVNKRALFGAQSCMYRMK